MFKTESIADLVAGASALRDGRYGVIEMVDGRLDAVHLRRWPKIVSLVDVWFLGKRYHARQQGNRCLVYYNQPRAFPNYLSLVYVLSTRDCTLRTFHGGLEVLEEIARIKRSDALLCDAWNVRISDGLARRWGWEAHAPSRWHRNFIKRFYGVYPARSKSVDCAQPERLQTAGV